MKPEMTTAGSRLVFGEKTWLMGILNVTPDSFSGDGLAKPGRSEDEIVSAALDRAREYVAAGAEILDVGAESTRPASVYGERPRVSPETEAGLAVPAVRALARELEGQALISIDTSHGPVARAALEAGATIVNDVRGAQPESGTAEVAAAAGAYLILMHNQQGAAYPEGLVHTVILWLQEAVERAVSAGVPRDRLLVDPGIGFGKATVQSVELLHRLPELKEALGLPLVVGTSRKRFLGELLGGAPVEDRLEGTAATVALAIAGGADVVRVHDVQQIARTVRVADAIARFNPR
jgi:dihydropteroate synthase